jgi:diguanylate cyclase (GGDEF)-like protein
MRHLSGLLSHFSLRTSLLLLLTGVAALLLADRAAEIVRERRADIAYASVEIRDLARRGAERQAELIAEAGVILRLAAGLPESSAGSAGACQAPFGRMVADLPWLKRMTVLDPAGRSICSSATPMLARAVADRAYFREALARRDFVVSDYVVSRLTFEPVIVAAMPRMAGSAVDSVVAAVIDIGWLSKLVAEAADHSSSQVFLMDRGGTVIAAYPEPKDWVGKSLSNRTKFWSEMQGAAGVVESTSFDGEPRIVGHARIAATGAVLAVMRSRSDVLAGANERAAGALGKIIVVAALCFVLVWLGGEHLVLRPIAALTRSAGRIGTGDLAERVETIGLAPELARLGAAFNTMAGQLAEQDAKLRQANACLTELASKDGLTGLANRRRFDEQIELEWRRVARLRKSMALLIVDVDHFKKFNDRYGHIEGDACLRQIARVLQDASRRPGDVAGRMGGEEFAILLPAAGLDDAVKIAESIRGRILALDIEHLDSPQGRVTVSIGVAAATAQRRTTLSAVLDEADAALYRAKRAGRNCVVGDSAPILLAS